MIAAESALYFKRENLVNVIGIHIDVVLLVLYVFRFRYLKK